MVKFGDVEITDEVVTRFTIGELMRYNELSSRPVSVGFDVFTDEERVFMIDMETKAGLFDEDEWEDNGVEGRVIKPQGLDLMEVCVGYFWDRYVAEGMYNPDVEYLAETLEIDEAELVAKFEVLGYVTEK